MNRRLRRFMGFFFRPQMFTCLLLWGFFGPTGIILDKAQAQSMHPLMADETIRQFETWFKKQGVDKDFSPESQEALILLTQDTHHQIQEKLKNEDYGSLGKKWMETQAKFLAYCLKELAEEPGERTFFNTKRIIYMLRAEEILEKKDMAIARNSDFNYRIVVKTILSYLGKSRLLRIPIPPTLPTTESLPSLDVPEDHFLFYSRSFLQKHPRTWQENEEWVNGEITRHLQKKYQIRDSFPSFRYDLTQAHRVVFFEEVKQTQTSPKINVRDAFDVRWKVKWSDEVHAEVIANRLFMAVGGKYADQVYASKAGTAGTTLILNDPKEPADKKALCHPVLPEDFITCLKKSKYKFNIKPFIMDKGQITAANAASVLQGLPQETLEKFSAPQLLGRHYITFKEALFEIRPPTEALLAGGPLSFSRFGSDKDRAVRGLLLFNAWINSNDTKEANNKGYLLQNFPVEGPGGEIRRQSLFVGTQHDMGKSLASAIGSANPNKLGNPSFIFVNGRTLRFNFLIMDMPQAWRHATYEDLFWMAERIVTIKREQLEEILKETHWPDFQQEAMVYRLLERRNRIARLFHLEHLVDEQNPLPPSRSVPLGTVQERKDAAAKYGVPWEELEEAYASRKREAGFKDEVLKSGWVKECAGTLLTRLLHWHRHPTGLDRRLSRYQFMAKVNPFRKSCGGLFKVEFF